MEDLYESVHSWGMEEEDDIYILYWKWFGEYWDPVDPTWLSANFAAVFPEEANLLNSHVEQTVILNDITSEKNKVLED